MTSTLVIEKFSYYRSSKSNKFWAILSSGNNYYAAYGRIGEVKDIQFTAHSSYRSITTKYKSKIKKGYVETDWETIYPGLYDKAYEMLFLKLMYQQL